MLRAFPEDGTHDSTDGVAGRERRGVLDDGGRTRGRHAASIRGARLGTGGYVAALTTYLQVIDSPQADSALEAIALQTGELFRTTELTTDGASPAFSPDGQVVLFETGPVGARVIRLVPVDGRSRPGVVLQGRGAVFSPDGSKLAYLKLPPSAELTAAQAAVEGAPRQSARCGRQLSRSSSRPTRRSSSAILPAGANRR